jgi:predicted MFS family arabinose efflux permease
VFAVLKNNPEFRKLWLSQVVSSAGDWFNRMALLALIGDLGGPSFGQGLGALFAVEIALRLLPTALFSTVAGPIADRLSRRGVMITTDLLRAGIVLGFLLVDEANELPLLYGLLFAQMSVGIFFDAARSASVPNTIPPEDLHDAYTLSAATWSMMLALGAALGGLLLTIVGLAGVFILDAATYLVSAAFVVWLRLPPTPRAEEPLTWKDVLLVRDLRRAVRHLRERGALPFTLAKCFWGACGGFIVMLSITGKVRFGPLFGEEAAAAGLATSLLYMARGVGTGIGPVLSRRIFGQSDRGLLRQIFTGYLVGAIGYAFFAPLESLPLALLMLVLAHCGGSALWVGSTTGWQSKIHDSFRGRAFSVEFLLLTVSFTIGALGTGALYDRTTSIELSIWVACAAVVLGSLVWRALAERILRQAEPA